MSRSVVARLAAAAGMLVMAGCARLPEPDAAPYPGAVPDAFQSGTPVSGGIDENWWTRFGDPQLNALIAESVGENPQIAQAEARAAQARAQAVIAGADGLPQLGAGFDASKQGQSRGDLGTVENDNYGLSLNVTWEIDLWGRIATQTAAAKGDYLASTETLRAIRQSIAAQTAKVYFATIDARQQVALSTSTVATFTETARQVGNRVDVGIAAPNDKHLAISNRETATSGLARQEESLQRTRRQLELLVRDYPDGTVATASMLPQLPPAPPVGLPAGLLSRRPDVQAAERGLRASGLRVASANRSLLPALSLTGSFGTSGTELENLLDGNFTLWSIAGNLIQPIFQGGRLRANIRLNEALQQEALEAYVETVLQAFGEVEAALAADALIRRSEAALCAAAAAGSDAERVSLNRYRQGVDPFLTVLESQQRALDAQSACISARRAGLENRIDLHLALGGGFSAPPADD